MSVAACARGTGRGRARTQVGRAARREAHGRGPASPDLDEAALLLAAALFDVKHQLESWRTRPFRYRPKGRTDRVDIASELQGELNLWIADWLEWDSLLDNVERVDPSLIAVRPHVPAHAEVPAAVDLATGREPGAIDGRPSGRPSSKMRRKAPRPNPSSCRSGPSPPGASIFTRGSATRSSGSRT